MQVGRLGEGGGWVERNENQCRGEFVVRLDGCAEAAAPDKDEPRRVLEILLEALPLKQAVGLAAEITRMKKNALYEAALTLQEGAGGE